MAFSVLPVAKARVLEGAFEVALLRTWAGVVGRVLLRLISSPRLYTADKMPARHKADTAQRENPYILLGSTSELFLAASGANNQIMSRPKGLPKTGDRVRGAPNKATDALVVGDL